MPVITAFLALMRGIRVKYLNNAEASSNFVMDLGAPGGNGGAHTSLAS